MGSSYFISADQSSGATWPFTPEQLADAIMRRWPDSSLTETPAEDLDINVRVDDDHCELTYQKDHQVFVFRDQDPLRPPMAIIHTLLRDLAPTVPAVWWADFDASLEPFDATAELEQVVDEFGM